MRALLALTFNDIVNKNPGSSLPVAKQYYQNLSSTLYFSINIVYLILYAVFVVLIMYNLMTLIRKLAFSDIKESYEKFSSGLTNVVYVCVGLLGLVSVRFFLKLILQTVGVADVDNVFINLPF
jgi:hypothetical protein